MFKPNTRSTCQRCSRNASRTGEIAGTLEGVSSMLRRMMMPTTATAMPDMNAARQPQAASASELIRLLSAPPTAEPSITPVVAANIAKLATKPRCFGGARSARNTIELVNSPPTAMPWNMRSTTMRNDAAMPMVA
jgi:hypothetical protein